MNRVVTVIALTSVIFLGTQALAVDSARQPTMSKHQMIAQMLGCMRKRMSADKNSSYHDSMKACKTQINKQSDTLPSVPPAASDTLGKP
jgi:hypothetical protein